MKLHYLLLLTLVLPLAACDKKPWPSDSRMWPSPTPTATPAPTPAPKEPQTVEELVKKYPALVAALLPTPTAVPALTPNPALVFNPWETAANHAWLEIRRSDNKNVQEEGLSPEVTLLYSDFEPVAEKYLDGRWKITFKLPAPPTTTTTAPSAPPAATATPTATPVPATTTTTP